MLKREAVRNSNQVKVTFIVPDDPDQPGISVVGDFNNWGPEGIRLIRRSNKTRSASVMLDAGHEYQFRYRTEDDNWFNDEEADAYILNEHGTENSVIKT